MCLVTWSVLRGRSIAAGPALLKLFMVLYLDTHTHSIISQHHLKWPTTPLRDHIALCVYVFSAESGNLRLPNGCRLGAKVSFNFSRRRAFYPVFLPLLPTTEYTQTGSLPTVGGWSQSSRPSLSVGPAGLRPVFSPFSLLFFPGEAFYILPSREQRLSPLDCSD